MGIMFEEKALCDILKAIRDKYGFKYDYVIIELAKKVKATKDNRAKYTDRSSNSNIKSSLQSDIIRLRNKNECPPMMFKNVYIKVLDQAENFKNFND
jgi:type I restriction enzyme R subunit